MPHGKFASANQKPKGTKPTTAKLIELGEREIVSGKQAISFLRLTRSYFHYFWVVIFFLFSIPGRSRPIVDMQSQIILSTTDIALEDNSSLQLASDGVFRQRYFS